MTNDKEEKKKFFKIPKNSTEKVRILTTGGSRTQSSISREDFLNKITKAISLGSIRFKELQKSYFLLDVNQNYYSLDVRKTLKKLNLKIETIFNPKKIFVSGNTNKIKKYNISALPKYVFNTIRNIEHVTSKDKIGQNLRRILSDSEKEEYHKINIILYDIKDFDKTNFIKSLSSDILSLKYIKYIENTGVISCSCSKSTIEIISKSPVVKRIYLPPKAMRMTQDLQEEQIFYYNDINFIRNEKENLPTLCIIDSGVSNIFDDYVKVRDNNNFSDNDDKLDHGTMVTSLALFGTDLLNMETNLKNGLEIISYKIEDNYDPYYEIDLVDEIINAINKYSNMTKVFSISYADPGIDIEARLDLINILDKKIQEKNVIVCISAGNIDLTDVRNNLYNYPEYLIKFPVFFPSEGKHIFSVGSLCKRTIENNKLFLSTHSRFGITPLLISRIEKRSEFFKPNIHTFGGSNLTNNEIDPEYQIPVINRNGDMTYSEGTSFATPLISALFAKLYEIYGSEYDNSETFKAILLNRCKYEELFDTPVFYITDLDNCLYCSKDIIINFEGEIEPLIRIEDRRILKKKEVISRGYITKFYLPKEAESFDIITVHSSNYNNDNILYHNTRLIVRIIKNNGVPLRKQYGTPNRFLPITFGHYRFRRNYEGITTCEITSETRGISNEELRDVIIRFGVSIKINLYGEYKNRFKEVYNEIKEKLDIKTILEIQPQQLNIEDFIEK